MYSSARSFHDKSAQPYERITDRRLAVVGVLGHHLEMRRGMHAVVLVVALAARVIAQSSASQSPRSAECSEWRECRQLALAAADRGDFETFHDLAWRAVQTGPAKDPSLMLMLARAQSLSGRPHDSLVMLLRLAEMGVASDA